MMPCLCVIEGSPRGVTASAALGRAHWRDGWVGLGLHLRGCVRRAKDEEREAWGCFIVALRCVVEGATAHGDLDSGLSLTFRA